MKRIPTHEVQEGMTLAEDLHGPDGRLILRRGAALKETTLFRLQKFGIMDVPVDAENSEPVTSAEPVAVVNIADTADEPIPSTQTEIDLYFPAEETNSDISALDTRFRRVIHDPFMQNLRDKVADFFFAEETA